MGAVIGSAIVTRNIVEAQPFGTWAQTIGTHSAGDEDVFRGLELACEGDGLILASNTNGAGAGKYDMLLMKIGLDGSMVWNRTIGGFDDDEPRDIERTKCSEPSDAGYIIAGRSRTNSVGGNDIWVTRVSSSGSIIWSKNYGTTRGDAAHAVTQTSDGDHYFVGGFITTSSKDFFIAKLNAIDGSVECQKTWNSPGGDDVVRELKILRNGNLIATGFERSIGGIDGDIWVKMLNGTDCSEIWQKTYGKSQFEESSTILEMPDDTIVIMEESRSFSSTVGAWIFRINPTDGDILQQKLWDGPNFDEFSVAQLTADGKRIVIAGEYKQSGAEAEDFWVLKLNAATFGKIYQIRQGGSGVDEAEDMVLLQNGRIAIAGFTRSPFSSGGQDLWITLTDQQGLLDSCNPSQVTNWNKPTDAVGQLTSATASTTSVLSTNTNLTIKIPTLQTDMPLLIQRFQCS